MPLWLVKLDYTGLDYPTGHTIFEIGGTSDVFNIQKVVFGSTKILVVASTTADTKAIKIDLSGQTTSDFVFN